MSMSPEVQAAFNKLRTSKIRYVVYQMKDLQIVPAFTGDNDETWKHLKAELSETLPGFIIYNYEYVTDDGRKTSKMYFIYWKPINTPQNLRIIYAQALSKFKNECDGTVYHEIEDEEELEELLKGEQF